MARTDQDSDQLSVAGGIDLPDEVDRIHKVTNAAEPLDELGRRLYTLLELHSDLELQFRQEDIAAMDESTKRMLISDLLRILDITPFQSNKL